MAPYEIKKKMYINDGARIDGKVVIITGCNRGVGKATAHELAKRGGKIYFACRNEEATLTAIDEIKDLTKNEQLYFLKLDLASFESIREFSRRFHELESRLDILINNAGALTNFQRTADGIEMNLATSYLGHFLLTNLLLDLLKVSSPSRIIMLSSNIYKAASLKKDNINSEISFPGPFKAYCNSKLCIIMFMRELSKRLEGTGVTVNALCPGSVDTGSITGFNSFVNFTLNTIKLFTDSTPEIGCQSTVLLAVEPSFSQVTGNYYSEFDKKDVSIKGEVDESWLWEKSVELTKLNE
ncbi:retinol dehydrogenase 13-like [Chironomus tepperi]|uniref:retinol dehydrogenase 13-like n=1 Tax=Chironomus tepperi TaxID=113505 RepID=UPI00391F0653